MAIVEVEILRATFEAAATYLLTSRRAVPMPTLPPIGNDRLIRQVEWKGGLTLVPGFPGYVPPPGTLLLRAPLELRHVSVAELQIDHGAAGASVSGDIWVLVATAPGAVRMSIIAFAATDTAPALLTGPVPVGSLPLPLPDDVAMVRAALVAGPQVVALRIATTLEDNPFSPPIGRLPAILAAPGAESTGNNWLIHLPPALFEEQILAKLQAGLDAQPADTSIESGPTARWCRLPDLQFGTPPASDRWGVIATADLEKEDACPSIFGDVDMSVSVAVIAEFNPSSTVSGLDVRLTVATDASDWDTFRCWLGSGGLLGLALGIATPFPGFLFAIQTLVTISETVRKEVGAAATAVPVPEFVEVSRTTSSVTHAGTIEMDPLETSFSNSLRVGAEGVDFRGTIIPVTLPHKPIFTPDSGPLGGTWKSKINCSHRSFDFHFAAQDVLISDNLGDQVTVDSVPVTVFSTSVGVPAAKCGVFIPNARPHVAVRIDGHGLSPGETGFVVVHSSAGLRAYDIGPIPHIAESLFPSDALLEVCDTFHKPNLLIEIQELKWLDPLPDFSYGHPALRQWQIVVDGVADLAALEILAGSPEQRTRVAAGSDFAGNPRRAAIEITTASDQRIWLHAPGAGPDARYAIVPRWLLPVQNIRLLEPVHSLEKSGGALDLRSANGLARYDLRTATLSELRPFDGERPSDPPGGRASRSVTLPGGKVAVLHNDNLIIALPINTLLKAESEAAAGPS